MKRNKQRSLPIQPHGSQGIYVRYIKRMMDGFIALLALVLLSPVWIIVTVLVKVKLGSPIIFKQERPGKNELSFHMYKFRTMTNEKDDSGCLLPDGERLTSFGKWLRATSLDELPELINILKGDMSIVGPRPLLTEYLPLYNEWQHRRHELRPGLTGYAQVHGRNSISWEEKFELDVYYIDHVDPLLDVKIILLTVVKVFKREGINGTTAITVDPFRGNAENKEHSHV